MNGFVPEGYERTCLSCSFSFVDESGNLHCIADENEPIVDDKYLCESWN